MVAVSACMGGTRGSGVLASAGDVLEMSVVRGVGGPRLSWHHNSRAQTKTHEGDSPLQTSLNCSS